MAWPRRPRRMMSCFASRALTSGGNHRPVVAEDPGEDVLARFQRGDQVLAQLVADVSRPVSGFLQLAEGRRAVAHRLTLRRRTCRRFTRAARFLPPTCRRPVSSAEKEPTGRRRPPPGARWRSVPAASRRNAPRRSRGPEAPSASPGVLPRTSFVAGVRIIATVRRTGFCPIWVAEATDSRTATIRRAVSTYVTSPAIEWVGPAGAGATSDSG